MEKIQKESKREFVTSAITFKIKLIRRNYEDVNMDGDICTLNQYYEYFNIDVYKDNKVSIWAAWRPFIISDAQRNTKGLKPPEGAYAQLNNRCYLSETTYNELIKIIDEMYIATETPEFIIAQKAAKEKQIQKEKAEDERYNQYEKQIKSGMCPKCGTWCYGDCEANK